MRARPRHFYVVADGQQPAANLSDRWGEDAARAWTAIPHALSRHLPALGLDAADVGVMVAILSHDGPRGLYPSLATIGGHVGVDRGHIRARVNMWVRRGPWEKTARHEATGARTSDRLTYNGL